MQAAGEIIGGCVMGSITFFIAISAVKLGRQNNLFEDRVIWKFFNILDDSSDLKLGMKWPW